jgi:hypothetical protein
LYPKPFFDEKRAFIISLFSLVKGRRDKAQGRSDKT